jgi:hypothetical protein
MMRFVNPANPHGPASISSQRYDWILQSHLMGRYWEGTSAAQMPGRWWRCGDGGFDAGGGGAGGALIADGDIDGGCDGGWHG